MIGGAHLPSAALLHEAKLGEDSFLLNFMGQSCNEDSSKIVGEAL